MKFKLDENVDPRAKEILGQGGHEVLTVQEQGLSGASDAQVATTAQREGYCLVTLDLDFANPLAFPPHLYAGIIVLRHPKPTTKRLLQLVEQLTQVLRTENPGSVQVVTDAVGGRFMVHGSRTGRHQGSKAIRQ